MLKIKNKLKSVLILQGVMGIFLISALLSEFQFGFNSNSQITHRALANRANANQANAKRAIASREPASQLPLQLLQLESQLQVSKPISALDQLIYGTLEGKYSYELENERLKKMNLNTNKKSEEGLIIKDRGSFLFEHQKKLGLVIEQQPKAKFSGSLYGPIREKDGSYSEEFPLSGKEHTARAKAVFTLDSKDRLLKLEIIW